MFKNPLIFYPASRHSHQFLSGQRQSDRPICSFTMPPDGYYGSIGIYSLINVFRLGEAGV